jgi:hypothetical protein
VVVLVDVCVPGRVVVGAVVPVVSGRVVLVGPGSGGVVTTGLVVEVVDDVGVPGTAEVVDDGPGAVVVVEVEVPGTTVVVAAGGRVLVVVVVVLRGVEDEVGCTSLVVLVERVVVGGGAVVVAGAAAVVGTVGTGVLAEAGLAGPTTRTNERTSGAPQPSDATTRWPTQFLEFLGELAMGTNLRGERTRQAQPAGHL